ncbi:MAG: YigZ family protein [Saprospiraceae bacterium]|nr:YigZ family protein [Saprospiraceae bacterium]
MDQIPDAYLTLAEPATGQFKDRGSKFFSYAYPVADEAAALDCLAALRKEHFKARHHCFAWRFGLDGQRFRANDDGEPSGTAGRPILGQIDALGLTDVLVVVVRYFGGTLLGASGLIQAYREAAADALEQGQTVERIVEDYVALSAPYPLVPDLMHVLKQLELSLVEEHYTDSGAEMVIGIRKSQTSSTLLQVKALLWKTSLAEAETLDWPPGMTLRGVPGFTNS